MAARGESTKRFGEKRQAIVHAASVLINAVGVQATTLSDVAKAIGLNATSITYYFSRKDQLVVAVYEETLDRMERMASEALAEPTPAKRLHKYVALHVELRARVRRGESGLLTALSEVRTLTQERQKPLLERYSKVVETIRQFFGQADTSEKRALFSARAHILLEAMMWWPVWSLRYSTLDFPRVQERIVDILSFGIPARKGEWDPFTLHNRTWRTDNGGDTKQNEEFLRVATIMINERGYRGASVNRIAEALNVTKGSFYHHHEAKDDLVLACFQNSYDRLSATQMAGQNAQGDYWTRLASVLHELLDVQFFDQTPLLRTTALQALEQEHRMDVVTRSNRLARRFAGMLIDGIADGSVRAIDPLVASQIIMSTLNGAYEARRWAQRFDDGEMAICTYVSALSEGLLADV
ncbi:TetR/AcrR family transcriptional regulator [Qipengyuania sp. S6317L1]|uniref:TetR/AcrR family transcriptional regulator n=1 Tax=Qipengyuania sp. S6317L1 TaxID=2926410 RepID=UPI001FF55115|nr:TetR/AcrR family transcriptional regulator [Qipengyuania sp. S6317L1]MCK0098431.1 TetR/AcrR family transcriptional regulator [Qipengyuania sp. S6317L1]